MRIDLMNLRNQARGRAVPLRRSALLGACLLTASLLVPGAAQSSPKPPRPPKPPAPVLALSSPVLALIAQTAGDRVFTGDHTVAEGESVGDVVVVGGNLRVIGEITGDAVVVGGDIVIAATGRILGDAVVTGGTIINEGGEVRGEMRTLDGSGSIADEVRRAVSGGPLVTAAPGAAAGREAARAARDGARANRDRTVRHQRSWFDPIRRGFAGLVSTVALGLVLGGMGAVLIFYGRSHLDVVSDTLRSSVPRSLAVGLAAGFLLVPAFVVMVVALAVTIIGIPLLLVAIPLYPLAFAGALAMGLIAAAHAIGERTAEQRDSFELRHRNAYAYFFTGLGMLLAPLIAAHLISMTGFLGFIATLLKVVTYAVIWATATAGFGAVILSRGGTRRTFIAPFARDPDLEPDPLFDEPAPRNPHA
jgi:hypothetical protein